MSLSSASYRALFDAAPDALVVVDPETGRIGECNQRYCDLCGVDRGDLVGRGFSTRVVTDGADADLLDRLREAAGNGGSVESRLRTGPGVSVPVEMRVSTVDSAVERSAESGTVGTAPSEERAIEAERFLVRVTDVTDRRHRERELERKSRAMDEAPFGVSISDPDREDNPLVFVNERFRELTGYDTDEVIGRNCRFLQGEGTDSARVAEIREAIDAEEPVTVELRNYRRDGTEFWNRVTVSPVRDEDGTVVNFVGFQEDVTEQRRNRKELELAYNLLETVRSGVFTTDPTPDGEFGYVNPALVSLLGAGSAEELREHPVDDFYVEPSERQELVEALRATDDDHVSREVRLETLDGETRDVNVTASLSTDETGSERVHKVVQDVTEYKEYENRLEEQRDSLEILNQMVRHDIRNDLQIVTAYTDFLSDHVDEDGVEYVSKIRESASHAVELTRTARDMADVMLEPETTQRPIGLRSTLEGEIDEIRSKHSEAVVTVTGSIPAVSVYADEMLDSVFRNLLSNAIQHNDKEIPSVRVDVADDEETVTVRIADNGPGVPDSQKEAIFGKGEKGLESGGTGIGLYLVETLVDGYGGDVWVEDRVEQGTESGLVGPEEADPEGAVFVVELRRAD